MVNNKGNNEEKKGFEENAELMQDERYKNLDQRVSNVWVTTYLDG